jgi:hypothetical protein
VTRRIIALAFALGLSPAILSAAPKIEKLKLEDGRDDNNKIAAPVFDASKVGPLRIGTITAAYSAKDKIVRRTGRKFPPAAAGPEYELGPEVKLADLFTEALRLEAPAMGFRTTPGDDFGYDIQGTLKDIYMESRQVYMGATLFYGYMDIEVQVKKAGGEAKTEHFRAHKYYQAVNAGMGRKDEAEQGLAHLLVEAAQETLARLNRLHFGAPPAKDVEGKVAFLDGKSRPNLHVVGLSGSKTATAHLISLIPRMTDENDRAAAIEALGRLGSPEAVAFLSERYAKEDEDCRWATLKAMDAIGGDAAKALAQKGLSDEHDPVKRLAGKVLAIAKE